MAPSTTIPVTNVPTPATLLPQIRHLKLAFLRKLLSFGRFRLRTTQPLKAEIAYRVWTFHELQVDDAIAIAGRTRLSQGFMGDRLRLVCGAVLAREIHYIKGTKGIGRLREERWEGKIPERV